MYIILKRKYKFYIDQKIDYLFAYFSSKSSIPQNIFNKSTSLCPSIILYFNTGRGTSLSFLVLVAFNTVLTKNSESFLASLSSRKLSDILLRLKSS